MKGARNVMIGASAGSGKTHALTNRFIAILAAGARPERIVALTFTRKAAGEFFDEILNKLARAAGDAASARALAGEIGDAALTQGRFLGLLRAVVDAMHRLRLGTLDGFFARIVRAFPLELGLAGEFEIIQAHAARVERRKALRGMLADGSAAGPAAMRDFIEAFKRATSGADEKRLGPRLDGLLDAHHEVFLAAPDEALWGNAGRIWPRGTPWLLPPPSPEPCIRALREWLPLTPLRPRQRERWNDFLSDFEAWTPGTPLPDALVYVVTKAIDAWEALGAGDAILRFDRQPQELSAVACSALRGLVHALFQREFARRLDATRGIHAVVRAYESNYHDRVRRAGKLTFADVQRLLEPVGSAAPDISRLDIDYRLDSGIDHWLLDEFQDTSFGQWRVLANLVDEAIQDPRRSFFCVGDVKQSIFGWREGDSRLFGEILAHYNAASPGTIVEDRLVRSWRSGPPLLEMVNAVFGNPAAMSALFPQPAVSRWAGEWRTHASAVPGRTGQAALLHAADRDGRWARTLDLLREIRPLERGLTCAILVQKNETAAHLADHLRREGAIPAVAESDLRVCTDNPLGAAILALFRAAAHPGDGMAWEHVRMTPLREILETEGLGTPSALSARILGEVHAAGFERAVEGWLRRAGARLGPTDSFSRERARQFAEAAGIFDLSGGRDIDEFLEFMDQHVVRDTEGAGSVRIMTIHKSKGLGFDVVLLPDLEGKTLMALDRGLSVKRAADRSVQWVLDRPNALFCSADPVLAGFVGDAQADACFERLCVLYVALTRAKRAMYAIVEPRPDSDSRNYPRFLAETLGCGTKEIRVGSLALEGAWSAGDPDWAGAVPEKTQGPPAVPRIVPLDRGRAPRVVRLPARVPSSQRVGSVAADRLFSLDSAAEFGAAVHALLARVEWWDGAGDPLGKGVSGPAADEARSCIRAPEHADAWIRSTAPGSVSEVWRERPFEGVIDGAWVTGRFDRVVVNRSPSGDPISAVVYDFKTGRLEPDADSSVEGSRHADQLAIYRRAAAALTGLPLSAVRGELIRTRPPGETDQGTS